MNTLDDVHSELEELAGIDLLNDSLQTVGDRIQEANKTLYDIWRDSGK